MAHNQRSLQVTDAYRDRVVGARDRALRDTVRRWHELMPQDLDEARWVDYATRRVGQAQLEAVRATAGYLTAFLTSELGRRTQGPQVTTARYVGDARDGRPLGDALRSPIIGTLAALKNGATTEDALAFGLQRAELAVGMDVDQAARTALSDAITADDRFDGWTRALAGTCGACAAKAAGHEHGLHFQVHPGCKCVQEPIVRDVPNLHPRPTGQEFFAALSAAQQNDMLGPDKAELVRSGQVPLEALVSQSQLETEPNWITETPLGALHPTA